MQNDPKNSKSPQQIKENRTENYLKRDEENEKEHDHTAGTENPTKMRDKQNSERSSDKVSLQNLDDNSNSVIPKRSDIPGSNKIQNNS